MRLRKKRIILKSTAHTPQRPYSERLFTDSGKKSKFSD